MNKNAQDIKYVINSSIIEHLLQILQELPAKTSFGAIHALQSLKPVEDDSVGNK